MHEFDIEPPTHAQRWRGVVTTEAEDALATGYCEEMAQLAAHDVAAGHYSAICINGEPVFYYDYPKALIPGHIYSDTGMDEFRISRACEYHFDQWFKEEDEE